MSNIVGEPFNKYVTGQVLARQLIHGKEKRSNEELSYLNSKTAYIRLTSGVKISSYERLKSLNLGNHPSFLGTGLAKFFVLFNGTSDVNNTLFSGIERQTQDIGQSILNKVTYGLGGNEFGLRPMPGIISCETKFRNRGSIREGTVQIKAHSREQFEIIQLLYIRLGFPILLEWGHTITVQNDLNINLNPNFSISSDFLNEKFKNDNEVLDALEAKRKESEGNYDAMYGKVQNFNWTFNKNGTYDITLKIISLGAVVESLKINVYTKDLIKSQQQSTPNSDEQPENDFDWVIKYKFSHNIGNYFFQFLANLGTPQLFNNLVGGQTGLNNIAFQSVGLKPNDKSTIRTYQFPDGNINFIHLPKRDRYYIRLGHFLEFIQKSIILENVDNKSNPIPLIKIDYETNTNYMYTEESQISSDPRICIIGGFNINGIQDQIIPELAVNPLKTRVKGVLVGLPMNIFINFSFILSKIDSLKDENGSTSFASLINSILEDINKTLGGVNHLELIVDDNKAKIIDGTPIAGIEKLINNPDLSDDSPEFNVYGYYNNGKPEQSAGFLKDVSFKTEVTNQLASLLTIGATANGGVVGEDATAFSKWNNGLEPIIGKNIVHPGLEKTNSNDLDQNAIKNFQSNNNQLIQAYLKYVDEYVKLDFKEDDLDGNTDLIINFLSYKQQLTNLINKSNKKSIASSTSSRGFLPLNLPIIMDGLSGIKIYNKIKIDTSFLPSDYPTSLKFIIKGVTNKVENNKWDTYIETISVPVIEVVQDINQTNQNNNQTQNTMAIPPVTPTSRAESRNNVNAQKLRETLTKLGYKEKGQEIDNGGKDISANIEKASSAVLNTIKKEIPNLKVTVTGGNDKYHQGLNYESRHKQGNAVDFVVEPHDNATLDKVVKILQAYAAGNSPNFRFIDEYRHLTAAGTANHFHMSWGAGTEGQAGLNTSLQLVKEGKITPIKIV